MGLRKIVGDNEGAIGLSLLLFVLFPSIVTMGVFAYEQATGTPLVSAEALPEVLGYQIDWVWQIALVVCIMIIVLFALTLLLKQNKPYRR